MAKKSFPERCVAWRNSAVFGKLGYSLLKLLGVEIPRSVQIGKGFELVHGGVGVVVHPRSKIGARVKIYPGVVLGRSDVYQSADKSKFEGFVVEDDVILSAGCKVLCKEGTLTIGKGTIVAANAVLTQSTGAMEIWAGIPARCIGQRPILEGKLEGSLDN